MSLFGSELAAVRHAQPIGLSGRVTGVSGLTLEACDLPLGVGRVCRVERAGGRACSVEVIGFRSDRTLLMPLSDTAGVRRGDRVVDTSAGSRVWCSDELLGRTIDGFGRPIDGGPLRAGGVARETDAPPPSPLGRELVREPITTSVRCIDALHTCGRGQRMGVFAGPGVGKSTLLAQIAANTDADVTVVGLIGERGREVREFLDVTLGASRRQRCVVVVSTGDDPPLLKLRAARVACTVSEYFRDRGHNVLLLLDSLTRLAQAQRQVGLAAGEPPATRGFPPSVFAMLPSILERAGRTASGSVTGFYTVLVEGDDFDEPIPDAVKGVTDGHVWLDRTLAERGHYPAIDPLRSISRVRGDVTDAAHEADARRVLGVLAAWRDIEQLVNLGAYVPGANARNDLAAQWHERIEEFLRQSSDDPATSAETRQRLRTLAGQLDQAGSALASKVEAR